MNTKHSAPPSGYPIRVVARRTGLTPDVIRVWERRYDAIQPQRTDTGRRTYTEEDVDKLLLLQSLLSGGRRIGDVAGLSIPELQELIRRDHSPRTRPEPSAADDATLPEFMGPCLEAIYGLDIEALSEILGREHARRGAQGYVEAVVGPLLRQIGHEWYKGTLAPYHEHFASEPIKNSLKGILGSAPARGKAPALVVTTPSGQHHELGALMVGALAAVQGWHVVYLGSDLPAGDIVSAATLAQAEAIGLSIVFPANDPALRRELQSLARDLPRTTRVIVGGAAAASYAPKLTSANMRFAESTTEFCALLAEMHSSSAVGR